VGPIRKEELEGGGNRLDTSETGTSPGSRASKLEKAGSDGPRVGHGDDEQIRGGGGNKEDSTEKQNVDGKRLTFTRTESMQEKERKERKNERHSKQLCGRFNAWLEVVRSAIVGKRKGVKLDKEWPVWGEDRFCSQARRGRDQGKKSEEDCFWERGCE